MLNPFARPSLTRAWTEYHQKLPETVWHDDGTVTIKNVRHARYRTKLDYDVTYTDETYDPAKVVRVWFGLETWARFQAHILLSFEFEDGRFLTSSAELRKTDEKDFVWWHTVVWNYEISYNSADELDALYLRTNVLKDRVYLYPLKLTSLMAKNVFRAMLGSVEAYSKDPFWYRLTHRNCTTEAFADLRRGGVPVPAWHWRYLVTEFADKVLYENGLIDTSKPFAQVRAEHYVTDKAQGLACDDSYSHKLREGLV